MTFLVDRRVATMADAGDESEKAGLELRLAPHGHEVREVGVAVVRGRHVGRLTPVLDPVGPLVEERCSRPSE